MSNHNRKRKRRSSTRLNHHRSDDYPDFHDTQSKFPAFLSHHDAYQASHAPYASSSTRSEFETEMLVPREGEHVQRQDPLQDLYIQAYEADVIRGPHARTTAESLEVVEYVHQASHFESEGDGSASVKVVPKIGSALIQLQLNGSTSTSYPSSSERGCSASGSGSIRMFDEDEDDGIATHPHPNPRKAIQSVHENSIWVDRYDARLLLDALPSTSSIASPTSHAIPTPASPTGWSDLSSDAEDTFFFDPEETEDFRREKRRRLLERTREERLRARREEDGDDGADEETRKEEDEEMWGGSDEEPDQTQKELMSRTATHLLSSPNPAQLEMRILANHGRDRRFAFLRGRWSKAWGLIKAKARFGLEQAKAKEEAKVNLLAKKTVENNVGLGLLAGYGSGSEEEEEGEAEAEAEAEGEEKKDEAEVLEKERAGHPLEEDIKVPENIIPQMTEDEMVKEARRKRLKAWSEQRKAAREKGEDVG